MKNFQYALPTFSPEELQKLHQATLSILENVGVVFHHDEALEIFTKHGFKTSDRRVFMTEKQLMDALATAPAQFKVLARDPEHSVTFGDGSLILTPGFAAPFMADDNGDQRPGTLKDQIDFIKLVQSSDTIDFNNCLMMQPQELAPQTVGAELLLACMEYSSKPLMSSAASKLEADQCLEMLRVLWGDQMDKDYVCLSSGISPLSPLQYSQEMLEGVLAYARAKQPLEFGALVMSGSTGPITLAGTLIQQSAELLAGIVLAQLISPGLACIYGGTSLAVDLKSGFGSCGAPEFALLQWGTVQLGKFYNLPTRSSGGLADSHVPDIQAGVETCQNLWAAAIGGADFMRHACGIISSYMAMNFNKFLVDEEICRRLKYLRKGIEVSDETLMLKAIGEVASKSSNYLIHPSTLKKCRTAFSPPGLFPRLTLEAWQNQNRPDFGQVAARELTKRLESYEKPDLDTSTVSGLKKIVEKYS